MKRLIKNSEMSIKFIIMALPVLFASFSTGFAAGKTAAAFLNIGVGAKPAAMGEAYTAVTGDLISVHWNPAGISSLVKPELNFTHSLWFEDISYSNFTGGIPAMGGYAAISISRLSAGPIDKYDFMGETLGETYTPRDLSALLSYAAGNERFSMGVSARFILSEIDGERGSSFSSDVGIQRKFGKINTGISALNLGTDMRFRKTKEPLPAILRTGILYPFEMLGASFNLTCDLNYSFRSGSRANAGISSDFNFRIEKRDFISGYSFEILTISPRIGIKSNTEGLDSLSRLTAGFGVSYADFSFDYAWGKFGDLGPTHRISLGHRI